MGYQFGDLEELTTDLVITFDSEPPSLNPVVSKTIPECKSFPESPESSSPPDKHVVLECIPAEYEGLPESHETSTPPNIQKDHAGNFLEFERKAILHHAKRTTIPIISENITAEDEEIYNYIETRKRNVYLTWLRDPAGKTILEDDLHGKMTSNGIKSWGETIWDFYKVLRTPDTRSSVSFCSGSMLANWCKENGEEHYPKAELYRNMKEAEPREIFPCDIAGLLADLKSPIGSECAETSEKDDTEEKGEDSKRMQRVPFNLSSTIPKLEQRLPLHLLPKKLIVHDPWNLLECDYYKRSQRKDWGTISDIIRIYKLQLSAHGLSRMEEDRNNAKETQDARATKQNVQSDSDCVYKGTRDLPKGFFYRDYLPKDLSKFEIGVPIEPPIYVVYPPEPSVPEVSEAHLYLSPAHSAGEGNHSYVYSAEWKIPQSVLVPPVICDKCVEEDVEKILQKEDGDDGEQKAERWRRKSGMIWQRHVFEPEISSYIMTKGQPGENKPERYVFSPDKITDSVEYEGPIRFIHTRVGYQNIASGYCKTHEMSKAPLLMTCVRVAAKISKPDDEHLENEGNNYQRFPRHFFEHWNGFNLVDPLVSEPTPVGAVVPQFYGVYEPDMERLKAEKVQEEGNENEEVQDANSNSDSDDEIPYLSPILLLEHCGKQIEPTKMSIDDRNACAALLFRFHDAGWIHWSVYPRNFLQQNGPLTELPTSRNKETPSFRLIDFGRSFKPVDKYQKRSEKNDEVLRGCRMLMLNDLLHRYYSSSMMK